MSGPFPRDIVERARRVRLAAFDVDGVLTDGRLLLGPRGEELKCFHARDGQGLVMLREAGFEIAILTGRSSPVVADRMAELGIHYVHQGCKDKLAVLDALLAILNLSPEEVSYTGDDLPDLAVARRVGLAVAVADAHPALARHCHFRTRLAGGQGAVREICDLLLLARGVLLAEDLAPVAGGPAPGFHRFR